MNKKGFTLVEVLIVIAIIAILLLILVPNVFVMIEKNNEKSCNSLLNNIESAAKIYVTNNKYDLGFGCDTPNNTKEIAIRTLINYGTLETDGTGKIINPINENDTLYDENNTEYDNKVKIKVTYDCTNRQFDYEVTGIDCTND